MKIVLDATVLIRAHHRSRALARKLLHEILERGHRLVLSNEMISEAVRVLRYPEFQSLYALDEADLLAYSQFLRSVSDVVILSPLYQAPFLRDPNDLDVLQTVENPLHRRWRFLRRGSIVLLCGAWDRGLHGEDSHGEARRIAVRVDVRQLANMAFKKFGSATLPNPA